MQRHLEEARPEPRGRGIVEKLDVKQLDYVGQEGSLSVAIL